MKVLVTGAGGFVGAHLVAELAGYEIDVVAGVRAGGDRKRLTPLLDKPRVCLTQLDVLDQEALRRAATGVTVIVHCAAYGAEPHQQDTARMLQVNVTGTFLAQQAARHCGARFIHLGTAFEYGAHTDVITEASALRPIGAYGATKAAASLIVLCSPGAPPPSVVVRPFNLFGSGDDSSRLIACILRAARERKPLKVTAGTQRRSFLWVKDVTRALRALVLLPADRFPSGRVFNLANRVPQSVREVALTVAERVGAVDLLQLGTAAERPDAPSDLYGLADSWLEFCSREGISWQPTPLVEAIDAICTQN